MKQTRVECQTKAHGAGRGSALDIPVSEQADYQTWLASRFPSRLEFEKMRVAAAAPDSLLSRRV
jgi:hypothetical protein